MSDLIKQLEQPASSAPQEPHAAASPQPSRRALLLACLAPSLPVLLLMIVGAVSEGIGLTKAPFNVFEHGPDLAIMALLGLIFYWHTVGWLAWSACQGMAAGLGRLPRFARWFGWALCGIALICGMLLYLASWACYLGTGTFGNLEALAFLAEEPQNLRMIWLYMVELRSAEFYGVFALVLISLLLLPPLLVWIVRSRWPLEATPAIWRQRRLAWMLLGTAFFLALWVVAMDGSPQRSLMRKHIMCRRSNVAVAVASSVVDRLTEEPIVACIPEEELVPLGYDYRPPAADRRSRPPIIFIAVESLRADIIGLSHQGREITPHFNRLAGKGLHLTRAYTQSSHSNFADPCVVSSLYPLRKPRQHFYTPGDPWPRTLIYDLLKPAGYQTAIISAQNEHWGGMAAFLETPNLDLFYEAQSSGAGQAIPLEDPGFAMEHAAGVLIGGNHTDEHTLDKVIAWTGEQARADRPYFVYINLQSSHFPYKLPANTPAPFQPAELAADVTFGHYPIERLEQVRNAYYNALHECDRQVGRLVAALRERGQLDDAILVVYGDNGECLYENGQVGHATNPFEPVIHIACVVHAPAYLQASREDYPFELVDVTPTVLGLMGWPTHPNFQGINALAADRPAFEERSLYIHTENPFTRTDAVIQAGRWKYVRDRFLGEDLLYDLAADPGEKKNLAEAEPERTAQLRELTSTWRRRQLAYYAIPFYYLKYYPPKPPKL